MVRSGKLAAMLSVAVGSAFLSLTGCAPTESSNPDVAPKVTKSDFSDDASSSQTDGEDRLDASAIVEWQLSEEFRTTNRRCVTDERAHSDAALRDPSDCSYNSTTIKPEYDPANGDEYVIPVVFHVIQRTNGEGDIDDSLIHSQIAILNEDFGAVGGTPGAGGAYSKIRFVLATEDPQGNPTTGINRHTNNTWFNDPGPGATSAMKNTLSWDSTRYFNIYTNNASGALGYATFPQEDAGNKSDGIVLLYSSVGRDAPDGGIYNQGRTATHEVGHYLGLFHTFQDGCGTGYTRGDRVNDTPPQSQPQFDCPSGSGAASCGGTADVHNYMNYTQDTCMFRFSVEQVNRMRCAIANYRPTLSQQSGPAPTGPTGTTGPSGDPEPEPNVAPVASFGFVVNGLTVSFTDQSTDSDGTVVAWEWTFGDGSNRSTAQNPEYTYAAAGTYTVTLTVLDDDGDVGSSSKSVTVTVPKSDGLESGKPVTSLKGARNEELQFAFDVPAGAKSVTIQTSGGTGDADLYVKFGAKPTTSSYDYRPYKWGNNETVNATPKTGRYYIMLRGYSSFSGVTLKATFTK